MAWKATLLAAVYNNDGCDFVVEAVDLEGKRKPLKIVGQRERLDDADLKAIVRDAVARAENALAGKNSLTIQVGQEIDLTPPEPPPAAEPTDLDLFIADLMKYRKEQVAAALPDDLKARLKPEWVASLPGR